MKGGGGTGSDYGHAWSKHCALTVKTSLLRLSVAGRIKYPLDYMSEDQLRNFGVEGILTDEEVDEKPIITSPKDSILTQIVLTQLNADVPLESKPENCRINNFIKAKGIIALFIWFFIFNKTMLSIYKAVDCICRQIPASSLPNKIAGYLLHHWEGVDNLVNR